MGMSYDRILGAASYSVHPYSSKVIGGDANGGATLQTPTAGFSQNLLGTLMGARPEPNNSTSHSRFSDSATAASGTPV